MKVLAGRASRPTPGTMSSTARRTRPRHPLDARGARRRDGPPGALALPAPHGRREHRARPRADALRRASIARRDARASARARSPGSADAELAPGRRVGDALARRPAARRDRPRAARGDARVLVHGRADRAASRRGRRAAVRRDPPAARARRRASSTSPTSSRRCGRSPTATRCCATAHRRHAATSRGDDADRAIVDDDGRPRVERALSARAAHGRARSCSSVDAVSRARACPIARRLDAPPRRGARHRRARRRRAHRAAARGLRPRSGAARRDPRGGVRGPRRRRHARLAQGVGLLSEDRKGEGLALALSIADNLTLSKLAASVRASAASARRARRARPRALDRPALGISARGARAARAPSSPAATSRRSRSRGCCTTTSTCSCSTSRRAASTSAARPRSTGSSTSWPRAARRSCSSAATCPSSSASATASP